MVGVRAANGTQTIDYRARQEVIVSSGTVESPLLLERSGIGHPEVLRGAGIDVRVESPNLGERVIEHLLFGFQVRLKGKIGLTQRVNTKPKQTWEGFKYLLTRSGPIATGSADVVCQFKSSPRLERPDTQAIFTEAIDPSGPALTPAQHSGVLFEAYHLHPTTASSLHLGGRLPENAPIIDAHYLEDHADREATAPVIGIARELFGKIPLAEYVLEEEFPGATVSSRDDALRYATETGSGIFHAVGACAMGPEDDDVVDSRLRVRGVDGLRVVDASVLPVQMAGNCQAPTMAVAWIAADLILDGR